MREAFLERLVTGDEGTLGSLWTPEGFSCHTLELPWHENKNGISCIPEGRYRCWYGMSPARKKMSYRLEKANGASAVPGRAGVLIHAGNFAGLKDEGRQQHVLGCILVGLSVGRLLNKYGDRQLAVLASGAALVEFENHMDREVFRLNVRNNTGTEMTV